MSSNGVTGIKRDEKVQRANEAAELLDNVKDLVVDFIRSADIVALTKNQSKDGHLEDDNSKRNIVHPYPPKDLERLLDFSLPEAGLGSEGVVSTAEDVLKYSVNTWDQGFLDKLYHSPRPVGLAAELLLSSLNTNVHIYQVSPALTVIEKQTTRALAAMFGFTGPYAGGVSQSGGSAANQTSIVIARNTLFPETKSDGYGGRRFVLFTSEHGHYSLEKAAQICGFGSNAVRSIPVDEQGRLQPEALEEAILKSKEKGETAFYVNATAGTTVLGSFDPLDEIADVCQRHNLWLHADGSWGGPVIFSEKHRHILKGIERADSIAMCPHKMMGVPLTCSLLLGKDLRQFHSAMTLPAGYLFHNGSEDETNGTAENGEGVNGNEAREEFWDLADLTPQCGRRGDVLKLALSWMYYGSSGYETYIDHGYEMASYLASLVEANSKFTLLSENPPPCMQVCFYFDQQSGPGCKRKNSRVTEKISKGLLCKGFMVDYAPGNGGKFLRVVVNGETRPETVDRLVKAIEDVGDSIASE